MKRPIRQTKGEHSPACATRRGGAACDCEALLVNRHVWVRCVCGNRWQELGRRDYHVEECRCLDPGDAVSRDDSIGRSREHIYNVDRLQP